MYQSNKMLSFIWSELKTINRHIAEKTHNSDQEIKAFYCLYLYVHSSVLTMLTVTRTLNELNTNGLNF